MTVAYKIWLDPDLLKNKSGIGRDSQLMVAWLKENFDSEIIQWPKRLTGHPRIRRMLLLASRIVFKRLICLPKRYAGTFYQSQLGPMLPGRGIATWVVRLHDLFPATNPEWFRWWATVVFKDSLEAAVSRNAIFLCDSAATELEVRRLYDGKQLKTFVVPCRLPDAPGIKCGTCQACTHVQATETIKYFISVGTVEPRKNYPFALSAWKEFSSRKDSRYKLIIVGRPGWKTKALQAEMSQSAVSQVIWFSDCCDGALEDLYKNAEALISFSLAEGFDLPPMEARQRFQKPLILSDIPVHREFHDGVAKFFKNRIELLEILDSPLVSTSISDYSDTAIKNLEQVTIFLKSIL